MEGSKKTAVTLCVDLDGTLIRSDVLFESALILLRTNPWYVFLLPLWLFRGKSYLKSAIAERVDLDVTHLPYRPEVLDFVKEQRSAGARLVLCTATHQKYAHQIADHLKIFDEVLATVGDRNMKGPQKAIALNERFGAEGFDYIGDDKADIAVWTVARQAIVVAPSAGLEKSLGRSNIEYVTVASPKARPMDYVRALRPHQWVKNLLLFVPLVAGHQVMESGLVVNATMAFLAFCLAAASTYLVNDLFDLQADRVHPTKNKRPFASGSIPLVAGLIAVPILLATSLGIALTLPREFLFVLVLYCVSTLAYSIKYKRFVIVDVMILAGLYTLRILAGSAATGITPTFWLLAFAMFLFLSLAMAKRNAELIAVQAAGQTMAKGRQYQVSDIPVMMMLGTGSGLIAVLVLALYVNSEQVNLQYPNPAMIWLLCPLMLYWVVRLWMKTSRGELHEDPVVFALTDRTSRLVGLLCVVVIGLAIW